MWSEKIVAEQDLIKPNEAFQSKLKNFLPFIHSFSPFCNFSWFPAYFAFLMLYKFRPSRKSFLIVLIRIRGTFQPPFIVSQTGNESSAVYLWLLTSKMKKNIVSWYIVFDHFREICLSALNHVQGLRTRVLVTTITETRWQNALNNRHIAAKRMIHLHPLRNMGHGGFTWAASIMAEDKNLKA